MKIEKVVVWRWPNLYRYATSTVTIAAFTLFPYAQLLRIRNTLSDIKSRCCKSNCLHTFNVKSVVMYHNLMLINCLNDVSPNFLIQIQIHPCLLSCGSDHHNVYSQILLYETTCNSWHLFLLIIKILKQLNSLYSLWGKNCMAAYNEKGIIIFYTSFP